MSEPQQHIEPLPWVAQFVQTPDSELQRLLSGYARIGPLSALPAADALQTLFAALPAGDAAWTILDQCVTKWLTEERALPDHALAQTKLERHLTEIRDALDIVASLHLPTAMAALRKDLSAWLEWAESRSSIGSLDILSVFLSTLAVTQRPYHRAFPAAPRYLLEPFWLQLAGQIGYRLRPSHLHSVLLGLRMLVERPNVPSERPWMTGLAHWARASRPTAAEFARQWRVLKAMYPHTTAYWRGQVDEVLNVTNALPDDIVEAWKQDVGLGNESSPPSLRRRGSTIDPPPLREVTSLIERIDQPLLSIRKEIERVIHVRLRYAEATGESHFLVTTACNLGKELLSKGSIIERPARGELATWLAQQAFGWQPANNYVWAILRDGLAAQGDYEAAEDIGWAAVSRFPDTEHARAQLSKVLGAMEGRQGDAETVLREAIARFPDSVVLSSQLAELLIAQDRLPEALTALREAVVRDSLTYEIMVRLIFAMEGRAAAQKEIRSVPPRFKAQLQHLQAMLDGGEDLPLVKVVTTGRRASRASSLPDSGPIGEARRSGALRRAATLGGRRTAGDLGPLDAVATTPPSEVDPVGLADLPLVGVKYEAWRDMLSVYRFRDEGAAERIIQWLSARGEDEPRTVEALRRLLVTHVANVTVAGLLQAVAANDNVRLDLVETALIPTDIALAA